MEISTNTAAKVAYKIQIKDNDGEMIEFADTSNPKLLIFGNNSLIPGFETHMKGLIAGEDFEFQLNPEESFGIYRDELIVDVPKTAFMIDGVLKEELLYLENEISMLDNSGNVVSGRVKRINSSDVRMDFNHKLAGKYLFVSGSIQHVRNVTEDDMAPSGGCGSGCGCASNSSQTSACGTENKELEHAYEEDCPSCGNPAELRGKGHGNCGCG
jgi:FKBP-type peptidyl-prolyl cis-trans isomerase SlyD